MTSDRAAVDYLVKHTVTTARDLPCRDAAQLLRGLLVLGGEHDALDPVRQLYVALNKCDAQLELLTRHQHDGQHPAA